MASQKGAMSTQKVEGAGLTIQSRKKGKGSSTGKGKASTNADESNTSASPQKTSSVAENFVNKELVEAKAMRLKYFNDPVKTWETIGARLNIKYSFGGASLKHDSILSYAGPPNVSSDLDHSDRIVYRVGTRICFHDTESGKKFFARTKASTIVNIVHIAFDHGSSYVAVCEMATRPGDTESSPVSQLSVYSLKNNYECASTIQNPKNSSGKSNFFVSVFTKNHRHIAAITGPQQGELQIFDWEYRTLIKSLSLSEMPTRLRCSPTHTMMLTTSGKFGLRGWYNAGDGISAVTLLSSASGAESVEDHTWMPSGNGLNKMLALSIPIEDDSIEQGRFAKKLCQYIHIFEGRDNKEDKKAADSKAKGPVGAPILLENRQKIRLRLTDGEDSKYTCVTKTQKGFLVGGLAGNILFYERTDDKREPYMEVKSLCIGSELNITGLAMMPSEHLVVIMTESGRLISIPTQMTVLPVATVDENGDEEEVLKNSEASDLSYGGTHVGPISSAAVCMERPIIATLCVEDNSIRIWNYETEKCEVNYNLGTDEPISLALHKNGLFMIVSFKDRLRGYNIAMANLIPYKEVIQKGCKKISFSHGGQYFACASGINLIVFDTTSFTKLQTFQGHMMPIKCITWEKGDLVLFSASVDGTIMGWPIARDGRMDLVPSNPRASAILDLEVEGESTVFLPPVTEVGEDGAPLTREEPAKYLLVSSNDGHLKTIDWYYNEHSWNNESKTVWGEDSHAITCMKISQSRRHLFAGTRGGAIRVYAWPLIGDAEAGLYVEIRAHSAAVVGIFESPREDALMSVGEDGAVFIYTLDKAKWSKFPISADLQAVEAAEDEVEEDPLQFNDQILLMSTDEMEEHLEEVSTLQRSLAELQSSSEYKIMQLQTTNQEEMNMMSHQFESNMNDERERYDQLRKEFDDKVKSLLSNMEAKEADSVKVVNDLENRYEHKLADQLDRYDRLSEEMELLRQKCEGLLLADRSDFTKQLNDTVHQARVREKKMRAENKRVTDDRASDEAAFKEILNQQENEYEDELRQLISAAEGELIMERENITKLRTLVQTKNTKLDQLKKRLVELNLASKARLSLLNNEKAEKKKLLETIEHYKKNLAEREEVVAEKEKIIMELRSKTRTLENFRFVLDYRLQQLSAERGPITSHIEGLERHISTMYEELVEEFEQKKNSQIEIEKNDQRNALVHQELAYEKVRSRKRERYINSFKRELGNIVSAMIIGKELEESVRLLYRKYVKGEAIGETTVKASDKAIEAAQQMVAEKDDDLSVFSSSQAGGGNGPVFPGGEKGKGFQLEIEETLIESAKEAERQKVSKEKEAYALKRSLSTTRSEALVMGRKRLNENSNLLFEVNDLRKQLRKSDGKIWQRDERIKELEHELKEMKKGHGGLRGSSKKLMPSIQASRPVATPGLQDFNAPTPNGITPPTGRAGQESSSMEAAEASDEQKRPDSASVAEQATRVMQPKVVVGSKSLKSIGMDTRTMKSKMTSSKQSILNTNTLTMGQSDTSTMPLSDEIDDSAQFDHTGNASPTTQQGAKTNEKIVARVPSSKIATGMNQKKSTIRERMIDRLQNEVDVLSEQLDDAFMIKENQRVEIAQLRKQMMSLTGKGFMDTNNKSQGLTSFAVPAGRGGNYEDTIHLSDEVAVSIEGEFDEGKIHDGSLLIAGEVVDVHQQQLTNADRTGKPSKEDLNDMKLIPAKKKEQEFVAPEIRVEDSATVEKNIVSVPSITGGITQEGSEVSQ